MLQGQVPVAAPANEVEEPSPTRQGEAAETGEIATFQDLYLYWRKLNPGCRQSTYREMQSAVKHFAGHVKKTPVELIRRDITRYRDHLLDKKLARTTVAKRISFIGSLLQTAVDGGLVEHNVSRGLRIPKRKVEFQRRRAFDIEELERIFDSPVYSKRRRYRAGGGEAVAWVPMLAFVTGARVEEICQLRVVDILRDVQLGPLMRITDTAKDQRVKTIGSRRQVPLHPDLIQAGFLEYVEAVEEQGHEWLFPDLDRDHDGRRSGNFSKWFSRYLRSTTGCGILDSRVVFHSFRHTFKSFCREAGIAEEVHDALTGHCSASVGRRYGHVPVKTLVAAIASLELPVRLPRIAVGEMK